MTEKRLTIVMHGSDRNLWKSGSLRVRVTDVFAGGGPRRLTEKKVKGPIFDLRMRLPFDAGQVYGIDVSAEGHRPAWQLVRRVDFVRGADQTERDDIILRLMLVPKKPASTDVDGGFGRLGAAGSPTVAPGTGVTGDQFNALKPEAMMALLNIEAKLRETLVDGSSLLSFVAGVRHVAVDRMFLFMRAAAKAAMPRSRDFAGAPGHDAPGSPPGLPDHPDSWKHTKFGEGNVQLSFSSAAEPFPTGLATAELCHSVDVDLDLARGLAHVKEYLDNNVFRPGQKTDQTLIYALLFNQGILPLYTLDPLPSTTTGPVEVDSAPSARKSAKRSRRRRPA